MLRDKLREARLSFFFSINQLSDGGVIRRGLLPFLIPNSFDTVHIEDDPMVCFILIVSKQIIGGQRHEPDLITQVGFLADKNPSFFNPVVMPTRSGGESRVFMETPFVRESRRRRYLRVL